MKRQLATTCLAVLGLLAAGDRSLAAVISFNVDINGTIGTVNGSGQSGPGEIAGVAPVGNWTGTWNGSFQNFGPNDLIDNDGNPTSLDLSVVGASDFYVTWPSGVAPGLDADGTYNRNLINGYANAGASTNPSITTAALSEIPYGEYDIYVYFSSDTAGREGSVTDGTSTFYFSTVGGPSVSDASGNAVFEQATDTSDLAVNGLGNYAVFEGLTGSSQLITVDIPEFGGFAGIQIVQVPEPSTFGLFGLASCVLGFVRRKR